MQTNCFLFQSSHANFLPSLIKIKELKSLGATKEIVSEHTKLLLSAPLIGQILVLA
jgi:hypothetical protein